ncbi:DUF6660 family protein [Ascidiimonas aurantiaca]|uniref:DUF6660 family protein n=1 Tax=Ascidiimonas aurantiaca TaxID=1685432 RepID=UPI0030ED715C
MKIAALILSFYILALNLQPCNDTDFPDDIAQMEVAMDMDLDHSEKGALDLCTPFCTCHCCHVHILDFGLPGFEPIMMDISMEPCIHFDNVGKEFTHSLLQPPQV